MISKPENSPGIWQKYLGYSQATGKTNFLASMGDPALPTLYSMIISFNCHIGVFGRIEYHLNTFKLLEDVPGT